MSEGGPFVIVGSGMAGGVAARTLREEGYGGDLVMIGHEPTIPFGRPPLSKTYLRGQESLTGWLVRPPEWYADNDVELIHDTVTGIDVTSRRVELLSGAPVPYQKVLITTGGDNRRFDVPGAELENVFQLRTVADSDAIRRAALRGGHAVVVGMGFIGCEVAASLRQLGVEVSAVLSGSVPLASVLGEVMGDLMNAIHREAGVELINHDSVVRFEGSGRVERAITKSGRKLECDFAVVAVGIQPTIGFLSGSPVALDNGVLVDSRCETNVPGVFAAGDVANVLHPQFGRVRVEHYNNAEKQGAAAARSMLGSGADYRYLYTFWSDQYDHKLEYAGHVRAWDTFVTRGSLADRRLVGFYLKDGRLMAAVGLDRGGDPELEPDSEMGKAAALIERGASPSPSMLADDDGEL